MDILQTLDIKANHLQNSGVVGSICHNKNKDSQGSIYHQKLQT